jgi:two-component system, chemotaxis family, CheB/CheR fusion protein
MAGSEDGPETNDADSEGGLALVVGIGYSAGGLEAAKELFRNVPESPGMAFVVVAHLDPDVTSSL